MKKYLWMSSAAVVISALRVKSSQILQQTLEGNSPLVVLKYAMN